MSRNLYGMCTSARVWYSQNEISSENSVVVLFHRAKHVPQWQTLTSSLAPGRPVNPLGVDSRRAGVKLLWRFPCRKNVFTGARLGPEESVNSRVSSGSHLPLPSRKPGDEVCFSTLQSRTHAHTGKQREPNRNWAWAKYSFGNFKKTQENLGFGDYGQKWNPLFFSAITRFSIFFGKTTKDNGINYVKYIIFIFKEK